MWSYQYVSNIWSTESPTILPWKQKQCEVPQWHSSCQPALVSCKARPNATILNDESYTNLKIFFFFRHWIQYQDSAGVEVTSKTSRPTRNIGFSFKCSTRATSSTTGPLLQFTRIASQKYKHHVVQQGADTSGKTYNLSTRRNVRLDLTFFIVASLSLLIR